MKGRGKRQFFSIKYWLKMCGISEHQNTERSQTTSASDSSENGGIESK